MTTSATKIGSKECDEGKIFIESQGFCVLAGIGLDDGRATKALDRDARTSGHATWHSLCSSRRTPLLPPPGRDFVLSAGIQGKRRHFLPRQSLGDDRAKRGWATAMRRYDYYSRINPSAREEISEVHRCEPYVMRR